MLVLAQACTGHLWRSGWLWFDWSMRSHLQTYPLRADLLSTAVGGIGAVAGMYGALMVERYSTVDYYALSIGVAALATVCSLGVRWKPQN